MATFSIITVNYNNSKGLEATICSVLSQTCKDFEFIIIDGDSTDGSKEVIKQHSDKIDYWVSEKDDGVYQAMNKGVLVAKGTYLNFMNSGDVFYDKNVLKKLLDMHFTEDIIVGKDIHYNSQGASFSTIFPLQLGMYTFYKSYLPHQSTFFKRILFEKRLYDERLRIAADWKFYIECICEDKSTVKMVNLIICNREQDGISSQQAQRSQDERRKVLEEKISPGVLSDYENLDKLDYHTTQKFLHIIKNKKGKNLMTLFIKIMYRLLGNKGMLTKDI